MISALVATASAGLFAGAAVYVSTVEHPARLSCGTALALREFAPSYRRGAVMQATLAVVGLLASIAAWWQADRVAFLIGGLLLGSVVPFTLVVIFPTNHRLLAPDLDPDSAESRALLERWGTLHAVRSVLGTLAFGTLVVSLARP
jgi:anthrone oxygenase-like protein